MLSFLKSKLHIEPTEGIVDTESALEAFAADLQTTVQDLKFDIYDQIRTIRDPEKPQNLEELSVVLEDLIHVYPLSGTTSEKLKQEQQIEVRHNHCLAYPTDQIESNRSQGHVRPNWSAVLLGHLRTFITL